MGSASYPLVCQHPAITFMNGLDHWNFCDVGGRATLWFPAPEWAHQLIDRLASAWTEYPWMTKVFLVIPRVFQHDWGRVSKHVVKRGTFCCRIDS
jgi:hypothetical protein